MDGFCYKDLVSLSSDLNQQIRDLAVDQTSSPSGGAGPPAESLAEAVQLVLSVGTLVRSWASGSTIGSTFVPCASISFAGIWNSQRVSTPAPDSSGLIAPMQQSAREVADIPTRSAPTHSLASILVNDSDLLDKGGVPETRPPFCHPSPTSSLLPSTEPQPPPPVRDRRWDPSVPPERGRLSEPIHNEFLSAVLTLSDSVATWNAGQRYAMASTKQKIALLAQPVSAS